MQLEEWRRPGRTFSYRGHSIFYRDEGAGPVLVLIHGFPTASWDWHKIWPALTARFRVVAPDMIGFGFSDKPTDYDYSLRDQASLHEALLRELGIDRADVLAHDYGDSVGQELLARHDERLASGAAGLSIRSMCFLNGGLFPERHRARIVQKLLDSPLGPLMAWMMNERSFRSGFVPVFGPNTIPSENELHACWQLVAHNHGQRIAHKLIGYIAERREFRERWVGALERTAVPLRFINGPEDPVSGRHMAERYVELVPNPDVVLLEGTGHYPQLEDPARVLDAFLAFATRA